MKVKIMALGAILALAGVACGGGDNNAGDATTTPTSTSTGATSPPPQTSGSNVGVEGLDFVPETLEVSTGTAVTWTWNGSIPHNVVARDGSFNSGEAVNSDTLTHTFNTAGTFEYVCEIHESAGMVGKIVVA